MKRHQEIPDFIKECPQIELPFAGARGWLVQGEGRQVVWIEFTETVDVPEHTHQEQWEFVLAGRVELKCEGCLEVVEAGDNFFIAAGEPHSARVYAGYTAMIVFNDPDRYQVKE